MFGSAWAAPEKARTSACPPVSALNTAVLPHEGNPMMPTFMALLLTEGDAHGAPGVSVCCEPAQTRTHPLLENTERVGFEPTWLAPIRFRGGAVMTASVPLLNSSTLYIRVSETTAAPHQTANWLATPPKDWHGAVKCLLGNWEHDSLTNIQPAVRNSPACQSGHQEFVAG